MGLACTVECHLVGITQPTNTMEGVLENTSGHGPLAKEARNLGVLGPQFKIKKEKKNA